MHRRLHNQSSAGQQTVNISRAALFRRSDLRQHQPRLTRGFAYLMWGIGYGGTVAAFHGGFNYIGGMDWRGYLIRCGLALVFQLVVTYMQFIYSSDWRHPGYFIPYVGDFGSNAFSYGPLVAPLLAAFVAALAGLILPKTDTLLLGALMVGWIASLFLIGVMTRAPELTFVEDDTPQP